MTMPQLVFLIFASQLYLASTSVIRKASYGRADVLPAKTEDEVDACRKMDMIVHTADLSLSTKVIGPESFNAYQCKGQCSLSQKNKFVTPHSLLMAVLKERNGNKTDGEACCVPTKLRPMSFTYYLARRGMFVMHTFKEMIVEECGCR
ncbi:hypothetical protein ACROYT_G043484 [Oculina patagonica]